jgi:translation initiation factor IF-1
LIEEILPNALYRVRLETGRTVNAGKAPELRHAVVRLLHGNRVLVQLSQYDPSRGKIVKKL